jgi:DNA-directed RNA polymerase subunit N (RpoN/RPB10)
MLVCPIACFTCQSVIADKWLEYNKFIQMGLSIDEALTAVKLNKNDECCRNMILAQPDIANTVLKAVPFNRMAQRVKPDYLTSPLNNRSFGGGAFHQQSDQRRDAIDAPLTFFGSKEKLLLKTLQSDYSQTNTLDEIWIQHELVKNTVVIQKNDEDIE